MSIKEIKINRFETIGQETIDLPNGQFYYLENGDFGNNINSVKQIVNTAVTQNDRCILRLLYSKIQPAGETTSYCFGLGQDTTSNNDVRLYYLNNTGWTSFVSGNINGSLLALYNPFFACMGSTLFFDGGNGYLAKYGITTSNMISTPSGFNISGGMVGGISWQGSLYGWDAGTKTTLYKITDTSLTSMISVPIDQKIVDLVPIGDYLAIICSASSNSNDGKAKMYLWDGITTTTFMSIVDIGYGIVTGGDILDGILYVLIGLPNGKGFRLKAYSGNIFQTVLTNYGKKNEVSDYQYLNPASDIKAYSGYLYFMVSGARVGSSYSNIYENVIMRYGRKNLGENYKLSVFKSLEVTPQEGSTLGILGNDFILNEFTNYPTASDIQIESVVYTGVRKTDRIESTLSTYSAQPLVIQTGIYTGGDISINKQLRSVAVQYKPLLSGGQVLIKYKKDAEITWTTIFTDTTVGSESREATTRETTDEVLPTFKQIQFRIEGIGQTEIMGMKFKWEDTINIYG